MYAAASVLGPVLGGYMTQYLSWRWVFLINLPLGAFACWYANRKLAGLPIPQRTPVIDYLGTVLMIIGLSTLLMSITRIGQGHGLGDTQVWGLLVVAVVALLGFVWHERRFREPLLPLHLFAIPAAVLCWCSVFFTSFQAIGLSVMMPLRFQTVTGAGADAAALYLLPLALGLPIGAFLGGRRTSQTGRYKPIILTGALLAPLGIMGMSFSPPDNLLLSVGFMLLTGFACGLQFPTSLVGAQNSVQARDIGVATSTLALFRSLGGAVGVACLSALLLAMLHGVQLADGALGGHGLEAMGDNVLLTGLNAVAGPARDALRLELGQTFQHLLWASAGISLLGLAVALALPNLELRGRGHGEK
jgi:MFS family permease